MTLKDFIKENFVLVVGLTLPVLLIVLFFMASVLPKSMAEPPKYDMLFTTTQYEPQNQHAPYEINFFIKDGALKARVWKNASSGSYNRKRVMVFEGKTQTVHELPYDTSKIGDITKETEVTFDEFNTMKLDGNTKAPDGYEYAGYSGYDGGIVTDLFSGGYHDRSPRVTKGAAVYKIPSNNGNYYSYYDIQFLGWILQK